MTTLFITIRRYGCPLILSLLLASTALAQPTSGTLIDKIIAKVDQQVLLQSELETAHQQYLLQGGQATPQLKEKILENLIFSKLILAQAHRDAVTVPQEDIDREFDQQMRYLISQLGSEAQVAQQWGRTVVETKQEMRAKIKERMLLDKMYAQILQDVPVTPQEVTTFFNSLAPHERPYFPAEVEIRQLVRYPRASPQAEQDLVAQLAALKERIQHGESFEAMAKTYSQDPGSASLGGDLGFWRLGELVPAYEAAARALKPGQISDPVTTPFGVHLIQLIAREKDRYHSRHIFLKSQPASLDLKGAKAALMQLRTAILAGKMTFAEAVQQAATDDPSTAPSTQGPQSPLGDMRTLVDQLPPDLFFIIDPMAPGDISEPVVFNTPDQRQAVRLIYLKDRVPPHDANLEQDYAKIRQLVAEKKQADALQTWLKSISHSFSVEVAPEYQGCELLKQLN